MAARAAVTAARSDGVDGRVSSAGFEPVSALAAPPLVALPSLPLSLALPRSRAWGVSAAAAAAVTAVSAEVSCVRVCAATVPATFVSVAGAGAYLRGSALRSSTHPAGLGGQWCDCVWFVFRSHQPQDLWHSSQACDLLFTSHPPTAACRSHQFDSARSRQRAAPRSESLLFALALPNWSMSAQKPHASGHCDRMKPGFDWHSPPCAQSSHEESSSRQGPPLCSVRGQLRGGCAVQCCL
mmetsp:Transcript_19623/g.49878  ORF Transcript_19623/g.49878 Transcript_19623/m.49878 type:complete len:239 (+) Transcript_19623:400-1116(+)